MSSSMEGTKRNLGAFAEKAGASDPHHSRHDERLAELSEQQVCMGMSVRGITA